jgi:plastocyanin
MELYFRMKKHVASRFSFTIGIAILSLVMGLTYFPLQYDQNIFGAYSNPTRPPLASSAESSSTANTTESSSSNALDAIEISGVYRWIDPSTGSENPELSLKANTNNTIQIQNPTDAEHELIIESQGNELTTSGDIAPSTSGQLSFRPNSTGVLEYHCEYHPETMKGTISVTS